MRSERDAHHQNDESFQQLFPRNLIAEEYTTHSQRRASARSLRRNACDTRVQSQRSKVQQPKPGRTFAFPLIAQMRWNRVGQPECYKINCALRSEEHTSELQ